MYILHFDYKFEYLKLFQYKYLIYYIFYILLSFISLQVGRPKTDTNNKRFAATLI